MFLMRLLPINKTEVNIVLQMFDIRRDPMEYLQFNALK